MKRVRLIHWHAAEAEERAARLRRLFWTVDCTVPGDAKAVNAIKKDPPDLLLIDLSRLPMQGRDVALLLRQSIAGRAIPLVFLGGAPDKVAKVRHALPFATFASWDEVALPAYLEAAAQPLEADRVPGEPEERRRLFDVYAGRKLGEKLALRKGQVVGLAGAPEGFARRLHGLPDGVTLNDGAHGECDVVLWFVHSQQQLVEGLVWMAVREDYESLWILWPKKAASLQSDLDQRTVRRAGLDAGLVDFKIAAIDAVWSGLRFTHRKEPPPAKAMRAERPARATNVKPRS
jgi:CheY-like chemotaxis protein